jgi:hypothetical protein
MCLIQLTAASCPAAHRHRRANLGAALGPSCEPHIIPIIPSPLKKTKLGACAICAAYRDHIASNIFAQNFLLMDDGKFATVAITTETYYQASSGVANCNPTGPSFAQPFHFDEIEI